MTTCLPPTPPHHPHTHRDIAGDVAGLSVGGAGLLVGTPGRLEDVMRRAPWLDYKHLEVRWGGGDGDRRGWFHRMNTGPGG
jgi:hypothetical protein